MEDANCRRGRVCAKGRAGVAVTSAAVFLRALPATWMLALAMLTSPPATKPANAHKLFLFQTFNN